MLLCSTSSKSRTARTEICTGKTLSIGQLIYKLSVGYIPQLPVAAVADPIEMLTFETSAATEDTVVLHYPSTGDKITEATLVTSRLNEEKYSQLLHYPELLKVAVVYRD
jgi:hypothetical protein